MVANFAAGGAAINQIASSLPARTEGGADRTRPPDARFHGGGGDERGRVSRAVDYRLSQPCPTIATCWRSARWASPTRRRRRRCARPCSAAAPRAGPAAAPASTMTGLRASARRSRRRWHSSRHSRDPLAVAAALGGRELAAIAGAVLAARRHRIPVLLDGFVATSAVAAARASRYAASLDHCRAGHVSAEAGHRALLRELKLDPLLDLEACGSARPPAPASPSCCCAPRWPATPGWQLSPRPAFPARASDETLPHDLRVD